MATLTIANGSTSRPTCWIDDASDTDAGEEKASDALANDDDDDVVSAHKADHAEMMESLRDAEKLQRKQEIRTKLWNRIRIVTALVSAAKSGAQKRETGDDEKVLTAGRGSRKRPRTTSGRLSRSSRPP